MESETVLNNSLQSVPSVGKNIVKYFWEKVTPVTTMPAGGYVLEDSPIEFQIEGRDDSFIDCKVKLLLSLLTNNKDANHYFFFRIFN
jgi:hypothetical protein